MTPEHRKGEAQNKKLCLNCLRGGHHVGQCNSGSCKKCYKKHNTLLHINQVSTLTQSSSAGNSNPTVNNHSSNTFPTEVFLSTVVIDIYDVKGKPHSCRALLDSGSQSNFITENLVNKLSMPQRSYSVPVFGISQSALQVKQSVEARIKSRFNAFETIIKCLVIERITNNLPHNSINVSSFDIPKNIKLADPHFNQSRPVDMLIGVDLFWRLLCIGQIKANDRHPCLQKTHFGWIISGTTANIETNHSATLCNISVNATLDDKLTMFWKLEECSKGTCLTPEEELCEDHFDKTVKRNQSGRFIVKLPFKEDPNKLGESYSLALKRFYNLEKRLNKMPELKVQYADFLDEYLSLGHMKSVDMNNRPTLISSGYYLPHHGVLKPCSSTTKLRVVFDGSAKSSSGTSLNDLLMVGPTLQQDLFSIVTRFRTHHIAITADIAKMYRQILVDESDVQFQRILWRNADHQPLHTFELSTVTYGTAAASYLAIRCIRKLAEVERENFPTGATVTLRDFYVDDLISGASTNDEARQVMFETSRLLQRGGFELRKWNSNVPELLDINNETQYERSIHSLDKEATKTLGLLWDSQNDFLLFDVPQTHTNNKITKRSILSFVASMYDPLGLLGPVIITGKILMQRLWQLKLCWDESVPNDVHFQFETWRQQLRTLTTLKIPRKVIPNNDIAHLELHGFCDSSEAAYGCCIYIKTVSREGSASSRLLCAKSRVAPAKQTSLPRLELCGALLLARLVDKVIETIDLEFKCIKYWTDSTIVLTWIKSTNRRWKTFVANRVGEIRELSNASAWNHVISENNPADVISRGADPESISNCLIWWQGPSWMMKNSSEPLKVNDFDQTGPILEEKLVMFCYDTNGNPSDIFSRFSSYTKLIRVVSYCMRFIKNLRSQVAKNRSKTCGKFLSSDEIEDTRKRVIRIVQGEQFLDDFQQLRLTGTVGTKSKLLSLTPFLDENGLIRVGGRLKHASVSYSQKHPFLLPAKHAFTSLIIDYYHRKELHAGVQGTIASIRSEYWPLSIRNSVKGALRRCIICFKASPIPENYIMGNLPSIRLERARPFINSGVDFCGPFLIRERKTRNSRTYKVYAAIFVCMVTKAVHIETVNDLSSEAFLNTLKRFMARRGKISTLSSDNGTNFVGANNELKELYNQFLSQKCQAALTKYFAEDNIKWHFIPPRSPHFGGLWEAAVKSMKHHLRRVAGNASLTFEQFHTLLIQIEAILNSRPLTPISEDPNDHSCLTPGHFLIGGSLTSVVEPDLLSLNVNRLNYWQRVERLKQHFWKRWYKEYLNQLQGRAKWKVQGMNSLSVGQLVIIKEDNVPPLRWVTGRVEQVHPGSDGVTRTATIRVGNSVVKRPVTKLCIIPM